jgi:effector-binding domain-containing protein
MFKIGDFSRLSRISVKALRYYDEIGLLKPVKVDQFTGYRNYSADQLPRLNYIVALKDTWLSLEEIATLINNSLNHTQMRDIFILKQAELRQRLSEEQKRLEQVENLLRQIEKEGKMPDYKVVVKKIEPQLVASVRGILPAYGEIGQFYGEIFKHLTKKIIFKPAAATMLICYDSEYKEKDVDVELCVPIKKSIPGSDRVKVYEMPEIDAACIVHKGPYENLNEAYGALMGWIDKNTYQITGPSRELYLTSPYDTEDKAKYVTEIQFPVEKSQE